jgi:hypothetical protein
LRQLNVKCFLLSDGCFGDGTDPEGMVATAIRSFLESGDATIIGVDISGRGTLRRNLATLGLSKLERLIVCESTPHSQVRKGTTMSTGMLDALQSTLAISSDCTLSIGVSEDDLILRNSSYLHFHVGQREYLRTKLRHVVPLIDQYETGVANTLAHFTGQMQRDLVLQHSDLVDFVRRAGDYFRAPAFGGKLARKNIDICRFIADKFPDEIAGVFATGYPFYVFDGDFSQLSIPAPPSVLKYCNEQHACFTHRCIKHDSFLANARGRFTDTQLLVLGIDTAHNQFEAYQYERAGLPLPPPESSPLTLAEYLAKNYFDIESDVWPCQYCAPIQLPELHPDQRVVRSTNNDCPRCNQTSITLRNVTGAAPDVDMIAVVHGDTLRIAEAIKRSIIDDNRYHLWDMDVQRTILQHDGPVDVFVIGFDDAIAALERLATVEWCGTTAETVALWCPTDRFPARLDLCFPLAFEPVVVNDDVLKLQIRRTREAFAGGQHPERVISALGKGSFWTQQLMTNPGLVESLKQRLVAWRTDSKSHVSDVPF